jgi:hypothetical protein
MRWVLGLSGRIDPLHDCCLRVSAKSLKPFDGLGARPFRSICMTSVRLTDALPDLDNLYVIDGSFFVSSGQKTPQALSCISQLQQVQLDRNQSLTNEHNDT